LDDITLVVSPLEDHSWYFFDCLSCAQRVVKAAPNSVALALASVRARTWTVPAEDLERIGPAEASPITVDDLLDALLLLGSDDRLAHLADADGRGARATSEATGSADPPSDAVSGADRADGVVLEGPGATASSPGEEGSRPAHPNAA
jgi:hypothetical protein